MKTNLITIMNVPGFPQTIKVENFSDENVKMGIAELLHVDTNNIQQLSIGEDNIFGIKGHLPGLDNLDSINIYYAESPKNYAHYIRVIYSISKNL